MSFPRIADLGDQLFELIAGDFDRTFRMYLRGPDVVSTESFFRVQTGLGHPLLPPHRCEKLMQTVTRLLFYRRPRWEKVYIRDSDSRSIWPHPNLR